MIAPLQERWPERFNIQNGVLGEFTEEFHDDTNENDIYDIREIVKKRLDDEDVKKNADIYNDLILKMVVAISRKVVDINVGGYWQEGGVIKIITTAHGFSAKVKQECESVYYSNIVIDSKGEDKMGLRDNIKRFSFDYHDSKKEDFVYDLINKVYANNAFRVRFRSGLSSVDAERTEVYTCGIDGIDYSRDLIVFYVDMTGRNKGINNWIKNNLFLNLKKTGRKTKRLQMGDACMYSSGDNKLIVESVNEKGFFPLQDRIVSISSMVVLSGVGAEYGDSGKPILDDQGNIVALVIGRPSNAKKDKVLAMSIEELLENIKSFEDRVDSVKSMLSFEKKNTPDI